MPQAINIDLTKDPDYIKMSAKDKAEAREAMLQEMALSDPEVAAHLKDPNIANQTRDMFFRGWDPNYDKTMFSGLPGGIRQAAEFSTQALAKTPAVWIGNLMRIGTTHEVPVINPETGAPELNPSGWAITREEPYQDWRKPWGETAMRAVEENEPVSMSEKFAHVFDNFALTLAGPMGVGRWSAYLPVAGRVAADAGTAVVMSQMMDQSLSAALLWGTIAAYQATKMPVTTMKASTETAPAAVNRAFSLNKGIAIDPRTKEVIINPGNAALQEGIVTKNFQALGLRAMGAKAKRLDQYRVLIDWATKSNPDLALNAFPLIEKLIVPRIASLKRLGLNTTRLDEILAAQRKMLEPTNGMVNPQLAWRMKSDIDAAVKYINGAERNPGLQSDLLGLRDGYNELLGEMIPGARQLGRRIMELDEVETQAALMQAAQKGGQNLRDWRFRESLGTGGVKISMWMRLQDMFGMGPTRARIMRWLRPMEDPDFMAVGRPQAAKISQRAGSPFAPTISEPLGLPSYYQPQVTGSVAGTRQIGPRIFEEGPSQLEFDWTGPGRQIGTRPQGQIGPHKIEMGPSQLEFTGTGPERQLVGGREVAGSLGSSSSYQRPELPPMAERRLPLLGTGAKETPGGGVMTPRSDMFRVEGGGKPDFGQQTVTPVSKGQASQQRSILKSEHPDPLGIRHGLSKSQEDEAIEGVWQRTLNRLKGNK